MFSLKKTKAFNIVINVKDLFIIGNMVDNVVIIKSPYYGCR